jgi:hypothetical protein
MACANKPGRVHSGRIVIMLRQWKGTAISAVKRLKELDGLAMQLVDVDYGSEIFNMDRTVFAKDMGDDG